jgi:predicted amidohydrolase YtcJ
VSSTLYRGGAVLAPAVPSATSLLIVDGTVVWIGGDDEADGLAPAADVVVDLRGALVTPGFVDAHVHLLGTALAAEGVDLSGATSAAEVVATVAAAARGPLGARSAVTGTLLTGHGWDEHRWDEPRPPRGTDLDTAVGGAPVVLFRVDRHAAVVSASVAEVLDLRARAGWHEDGLVTGEALAVVRRAVLDVDPERRDTLHRAALRAAAEAGVVAVHEHSAPDTGTRADLATLLDLTADPASGLPLVIGYRADAREILAAIPGLTGLGGDLAVDGTIGTRTAALRAPYADLPLGAPDATGRLDLSAEQVSNHVAAVTRAGLQAAFHVVGDRAMDEVLLGFRAASDVEGVEALRGAGHRIEHGTMLDAPALATAVLLGLTCAVQPGTDAAWGGDDGMHAARLGRGRAASLLPVADLLAAGVPVAIGSGAPSAPLDPWAAVRAAVRHRTPDQRVPVRAAVEAATRGGWAAAGLGGSGAGELRVGAPAHLAVWEIGEDETLDRADGPAPSAFGTAWRAYGTDRRDPVLPALADDDPLPRCLRTVRAGVVLHDTLG